MGEIRNKLRIRTDRHGYPRPSRVSGQKVGSSGTEKWQECLVKIKGRVTVHNQYKTPYFLFNK